MSTVAEGIRMAEDPAKYFARSNRAAHAVPREDMEAMQLAVLQQRFATLRDRLPVLEATAEEQGITDISSFEDGGRLLFPHTVYKSYPVSLLERNRFPQLTKWLSRLTTTDLSRAEVGDCEGIDAWLAALEESTGLSVTHSSGTSGTMTFLPRSSEGYRIISDVFGMASREFHDLSDRDNAPWHTFYLGFQGGRSHAGRAAQWALDNFAHDTDHFYPLYHVDMSSDVMFMAARVRQAEARGELSRLEISPAMRTRQAEFEAVQRDTGKALERTFEQLVALKGERVYIGGMSGAVTDLAQRGLALGMRNIFQEGRGARGQLGRSLQGLHRREAHRPLLRHDRSDDDQRQMQRGPLSCAALGDRLCARSRHRPDPSPAGRAHRPRGLLRFGP